MALEFKHNPTGRSLESSDLAKLDLSQLDTRVRHLVAEEWRAVELAHGKIALDDEALRPMEFKPGLYVIDSLSQPLDISGSSRIDFDWHGKLAEHHVAGIPVPVTFFRGCEDRESDSDLSRTNPANVWAAPDGASMFAMIHQSVPVAVEDVVLFHELKEAELYYVQGVPISVAHRVAVHLTREYAEKHLAPEELVLLADFEGKLAQALKVAA